MAVKRSDQIIKRETSVIPALVARGDSTVHWENTVILWGGIGCAAFFGYLLLVTLAMPDPKSRCDGIIDHSTATP